MTRSRKAAVKVTKKAPGRKAAPTKKAAQAKRSRKATPAPSAASPKEYAAMTKVLLGILPDGGPALGTGDVFEAVRKATSRNAFPGDTHRMWAKQVLADLAARGVLSREGVNPEMWKRA